MNTTALKSFAPAVRRQLMEAVGRKLDVVLAAQTPDYRTTYARQVEALRKLAHADRQGLVERVSYTWFNRLAALRYLDARNWHPFRVRVLMPASPEETQPELLRVMRTGSLPEELQRYVDVGRLNDLLDGRIPSDDAQGEVYRHLVLAACRFYHSLLPDLFERLDDETELLLPDDLLTEHSVAHGFRTQITDEDCGEVEVLGWLYQFYISEKKDAVMARKSAVPTEDIPAVTQLFTPHWIVRYLVENSLGRLWLLNRPESRLREQMPYYIEGEAETDFLRIATPQEIRVIDPAVGSGHMLTYAFDLLYAIYQEEGYAPSEIPGLILQHNLYGLDIDPRAAQLASLALGLKAREKSRRFFHRDQLVQPHVIALQDVRFEDRELREYINALDLEELFNQPALTLLRQFEEATTFGALVQPVLSECDLQQMRERIEERELGIELFLNDTHQKVLRVLGQGEYLAQQYHVVLANPPYMGAGLMNKQLKTYVSKQFPAGSADLYGAFMLQSLHFLRQRGILGMITIPNWLFLESFESLREIILDVGHIRSLVHNGRGVWGGDFGSCAFTISKKQDVLHRGVYRRLFRKQGEIQSNKEIEANFFDLASFPEYLANAEDFAAIPGKIIAYWTSPALRAVFRSSRPLGTVIPIKSGMSTTDNQRFLRRWYEVAASATELNAMSHEEARRSGRKWFPFKKGGDFRKWYGNDEYVLNWQNDGEEIKRAVISNPNDPRTTHWSRRIFGTEYFFLPSITWSKISSSYFSVRVSDGGSIFSDASNGAFPRKDLPFYASFLNSSLALEYLRILSPTINYKAGDIAKLPLLNEVDELVKQAADLRARNCIDLARLDWNNAETSWGFSESPLLLSAKGQEGTLSESWTAWHARCDAAIKRMHDLETENNQVWIDAYQLQGELSSAVSSRTITLARAEVRADMVAFLSYAVGCMMGRYSLDASGLILANAGDTVTNYIAKVGKPLDQLTFAPDEDGVIPVLDGEWFEDDIVSRTRDFLRATFGEDTLRENLRFIEESLGKELRKYFLTDFYKDHLQTYKKRPIYWMVQSPRKGFSVLIYLHRYTRDTMNVVLNRYLREYQAKLRDRLAHLARVQADDSLGTRDRTAARKEADKLTKVLHECEEWERQTLLPLAQARVELDLDDGVKVNYLKLGEALAPIPGLASREEE